MKTNYELRKIPSDDSLHSHESQERRDSEYSQQSFRMSEARTSTSKAMAKYSNYPEYQEILNTMICYLNSDLSPEEYTEFISHAIDP